VIDHSTVKRTRPGSGSRRGIANWRRAAGVGVMLLVLEYLVLPQLAGARKALHLLVRVNLGLVGLAILLEAASLLAYAQLTRVVLPRRCRPPLSTVLRIDLSTLAVTHVVPGGSAAGATLGYRLLGSAGVDGADAGFALAAQGLGSALVLNVLLWLGLVVSIPLRGFNPLYGTAAALGAAVIVLLALAVLGLTRGEVRAANWLRRLARRLPFLDEDAVVRGLHRVAQRLRELGSDGGLLSRAIAWAALNWLLDAASLWVFLLAFGHRMGPDGLLVSYGLANVLAAIPITPGGLGITEAVLVSTLVGFGTARSVALLAVIGYRLVNFWLPIPIGALAYLSLPGRPAKPGVTRTEQLDQLATEARAEAEHAAEWAARRGLRVRRRGTGSTG
jgi:uncharacterized protein (TIRG00374 family)